MTHFDLVEADYRWITVKLNEIAERHCQSRIVSTLEGGYNRSALGCGVAPHIDSLIGKIIHGHSDQMRLFSEADFSLTAPRNEDVDSVEAAGNAHCGDVRIYGQCDQLHRPGCLSLPKRCPHGAGGTVSPNDQGAAFDPNVDVLCTLLSGVYPNAIARGRL